jgi:hypothetical protein
LLDQTVRVVVLSKFVSLHNTGTWWLQVLAHLASDACDGLMLGGELVHSIKQHKAVGQQAVPCKGAPQGRLARFQQMDAAQVSRCSTSWAA